MACEAENLMIMAMAPGAGEPNDELSHDSRALHSASPPIRPSNEGVYAACGHLQPLCRSALSVYSLLLPAPTMARIF